MSQPDYSDTDLMAYADGQASPEIAEAIGRAIETDADLAARVAAFSETGLRAREALTPLLNEPVPDALTRRIADLVDEHEAAARPVENVVALPPKTRAPAPAGIGWSVPIAASIAVVIGGIAGYLAGLPEARQTSGVQMANLDQPELSRALSAVPSGREQTLKDEARFRAIASFTDPNRNLCREFELDRTDGQTVVAVACRSDSDWALQFMVVAGETADGYAPASSLESLDAYLTAVGAGDPLDDAAEAAALDALR